MGLFRLIHHNKTVILVVFALYFLLWLTSSTLNRSTDLSERSPWNRLKDRSNSTFFVILDHLFDLKWNLLLIDPYVLNYLFLDRLSFDKLDRQLITFGILDPSLERFFPYLESKHFRVSTSRSHTLDHIFIEYQEKIVHLAILHPYHTFYLVRTNTLSLAGQIELPYGDTLRAVEHVETDLYENLFSYPEKVSHFLWLYQTSEFLYCNQSLAIQMETEYRLYQNTSQLHLTVKPMRNVVTTLDRLEKHYWLAGGTLLGWYRHCGLIPFTQDADFGLFAEEYDESIRNAFLGNSLSYLWGALGLINDSLEFRLYTGRFTLDLFWAYQTGDHRWCGYQVNRAKFRRTLPLLPKLCSGNLFGYRFSIPCSPVDYLNDEYGLSQWQRPMERNYTWINMKFHSYWDDLSWLYATRLYTRDGRLREDKFAIDWISKHSNYSLERIPSFLNVLPEHPVSLPPLKRELVYSPSNPRRKRANRTTAA